MSTFLRFWAISKNFKTQHFPSKTLTTSLVIYPKIAKIATNFPKFGSQAPPTKPSSEAAYPLTSSLRAFHHYRRRRHYHHYYYNHYHQDYHLPIVWQS